MGCLPQISSHEYGSKSLMPKPADWTTKHDQIILNLQSPKLVPSWHAPAAKTKKQCTNCKHQTKKNCSWQRLRSIRYPFFPGVSLYLLSQSHTSTRRLTSIQKSFQDLETPQSWFRKWEFVPFWASLWEIRRVLFRFLFRKKEERTILAKFVISIYSEIWGEKTKLSLEAHPGWKTPRFAAYHHVGLCWPAAGGPHIVGHAAHARVCGSRQWVQRFQEAFFLGSGEKWWSDFGRLDLPSCQILAIGWMQWCNWKKTPTLNWSWRFLGFSGEVEVWCSQIHRFLFCSVLFPKSGQSSQSEP